MRLNALLLLIVASCLSVQAADSFYTLSGRVTDRSAVPLAYAVVSTAAGKAVATTDDDGRFSLTLPGGNYTLQVSAMSFRIAEIPVGLVRDTLLDIVLEEDAQALKAAVVTGKSAARKLEEGAFSVNAVSITPNINKLITLNSLIDRTAGVKVRHGGGVGSDFELSVNGMSGNSIRYFIDGVPLETRGSGLTLENLPLNTVERIEIYKGVVPTSLSSDALGGAVNIVTAKKRRNYLDASCGVGSFATHAGELAGQYCIPGTAVSIRPSFGVNYARNNYMMRNVEVWSEEEDRYIHTDRRRFHDAYFSAFGQLEAAVNEVKWADRFSAGATFSHVDKELQTGAMQNKVYGEAVRHVRSAGLSSRYAKRWGRLSLRLDLSHTWDRSWTVDTAYRKYSWDGSWMPSSGNELNNKARTIRVYVRPLTVASAGADYDLNAHNTLSVGYMYNRQGNERYDEADAAFEPSDDIVAKHILSFTCTHSFFDEKWQTSWFVKDYVNALSVGQHDNPAISGSDKVAAAATDSYWGGGLGSRYALRESFSLKASCEHSVRLPLSRELLGNGTTVYPNLTLHPETSNNANAGVFGTWLFSGAHQLGYEVNGFIRHVQNYIRATVSEREGMMQYVNEPAIDIKGFDFELTYGWSGRLRLMLNGSWSDARDLKKYKSDGNPSATYRNRVPNRPWMFGNAEAEYTFRNLFGKGCHLQAGISHQYIHWYYLNWETFGAAVSKARIPTQNITALSLSCSWREDRYNLSAGCSNLFDCLAYDNYMLQKPGRSFDIKFRVFIQ